MKADNSGKPDLDLFLWSKVTEGDKEAFELLFNKYYALLCILAKRYTGNIASSREVVQDLFIYLWEHRNDLNIRFSFRLYLCQAAKFNSIRYVEKKRKFSLPEELISEPEPQEFFDQVEYAELQDRILNTIDTLPDQCKKVFTLSRFEQLRYSDIANKLQISIKTVESHISKALRILEANLGHF